MIRYRHAVRGPDGLREGPGEQARDRVGHPRPDADDRTPSPNSGTHTAETGRARQRGPCPDDRGLAHGTQERAAETPAGPRTAQVGTHNLQALTER